MHTPGGALLIVVALLAGPANAAAQYRPPRPVLPAPATARSGKADDARARLLARLAALRPGRGSRAPALPGAAAAAVTETEPNDTITTASPVSLGDTVSGVINPDWDIDFFAIDLTAGLVLDIDVDARVLGSPLDPVIGLFDRDGSCCLMVNDDWAGPDSRILYPIPADGRYFAAIVNYEGNGGPEYSYRMAFRQAAFDEIEPNDTPASATVITLPDTIIAILNPASESDYFALDLPAGTRLSVEVAALAGFDGITTLYDLNGTTVLAVDTIHSGPYGLEHVIPAAGRYFLRIADQHPQGTNSRVYLLVADSIPLGPGDPLTRFASGPGAAVRLAAGATGELYLADGYASRLLWVSATGVVSELARDMYAADLVVDGLGDLLVSGYRPQLGAGAVWRVAPTGAVSVAIGDASNPSLITIGPDGDVWTLGCTQQCPSLRRYDPGGRLKSTATLSTFPSAMAFSPRGDLHFATMMGIERLSGSTLQRVITLDNGARGVAFDQDGRLYVLPGYPYNVVKLYDSTYQLVGENFARADNGTGFLGVAFARDAAGAMTARLMLSGVLVSSSMPTFAIYQANLSGVEAPGFRIGVDLLRITGALPDTLVMGAAYSSTLEVVNPPGAVTWSIDDGALPAGLVLDAASGTLSGTPEKGGHFAARIRAASGTMVGYAAVDVWVMEPGVALDDAVNALLGVPGLLTPELERYLDLQGNRNGGFDVGDLRAWLRARGEIPAPPAQSSEPGRSGGR